MSPTKLKETLIKQFNETVENLRRLEGAIAACDNLIEASTKEEEVEEGSDA